MRKKKLICGLLSAFVMLSLGSFTSIYAASTDTLSDYPEYKEIVQKYYNGASAAWNISQFQENNLCYLAGYYSDINKLGYFLQDVDNNGTDELFIGAIDDGSDTYEGMFFDMYTLINGRLSLVTTSGERDRYYLCKDNTIANEGSGSAFLSMYHYYTYTDGKLHLKESVVYDEERNPQSPWFFSTTDSTNYDMDEFTSISEADADSVRNKYEYAELPFISLADADL